jgi:acyl-CoA reductase-like NAD-dependent aldehyde dehydrogenase
MVNCVSYGLSGSVWTSNITRGHVFSKRMETGMVGGGRVFSCEGVGELLAGEGPPSPVWGGEGKRRGEGGGQAFARVFHRGQEHLRVFGLM